MSTFLSSMIVQVGVQGLDSMDRAFKRAAGSVQDLGKRMQDTGLALSVGISAPLIGVGVAAVKAAADMEAAQVAFTTMAKSSDVARQHIADLKRFALQTPFTFPELTQGSRLLQAYGTSVQDVIPRLRVLGDAVAALGGNAAGTPDLLERVIRSFGEIGTRGRITGEQLREMSRAGIAALTALGQHLGVTEGQARDMVEAGLVDAKTATEALINFMRQRYGGGMEALSKATKGQFSNIRDAITFTLADIGDVFLPVVNSFMRNFAFPILLKLREVAGAFKELPSSIQIPAVGAAGLVAGLPLAIFGFGSLAFHLTNIETMVKRMAPMVTNFAAAFSARLAPALVDVTPAIGAMVGATTQFGTAATAASIASKALSGTLVVGVFAAAAYEVLKLASAIYQLVDAETLLGTLRKGEAAGFAALENRLKQYGADISQLRATYEKEMAAATRTVTMTGERGIPIKETVVDTGAQAAAAEKYRRALLDLAKTHAVTRAELIQGIDVSGILKGFNIRSAQEIRAEMAKVQESIGELRKAKATYDAFIASRQATIPLPQKVENVDIVRLEKHYRDLEKSLTIVDEKLGKAERTGKQFTETMALLRAETEIQKIRDLERDIIKFTIASEKAAAVEKELAAFDALDALGFQVPLSQDAAWLKTTREGLAGLKVDMADAAEAHHVLKTASDMVTASQEAMAAAFWDAGEFMRRTDAALKAFSLKDNIDQAQQLRAAFSDLMIAFAAGEISLATATRAWIAYQYALIATGETAPETAIRLERLRLQISGIADASTKMARELSGSSSAALAAQAEAARKIYEQVLKDERASYADRVRAYQTFLDTQLDVLRDRKAGETGEAKKSTDAQIRELEKFSRKNERELAKIEGEHRRSTRNLVTFWRDFGNQVSTIITDFSRSLVDLIFPSSTGKSKDTEAITALGIAAGVSGKQLEDLTAVLESLALATGSDFRGLAEGAAAAFKAFGLSVTDQIPLMQQLFVIARDTKTPIKDLLDAVTKNAPALRAMGLSAADAATLYGQLASSGEDASKIFTTLSDAFKKFTEQAWTDPAEALRKVIAMIREAGSTAEANQIAVAHFGDAGVEMARIIRAGSLDVKALTTNLQDAAQALGEAADKMKEAQQETGKLGEIFKELEKAIVRAIAESAIKAFGRWIQQLTGAKDPLDLIWKGIQKIAEWLGIMHKAATTATDSLDTLNKIAKNIPVNVPGPLSGGWGQEIPGAPSGGGTGSAGAGAGGGAAGGAMGTVNMISGIVSAIGSLGSFIEGIRQEGSLNAIEHEVRYSQIHLSYILDKVNEYLPGIRDIHDYLWDVQATYLRDISDYAYQISENVKGLIGGGPMLTPALATATLPNIPISTASYSNAYNSISNVAGGDTYYIIIDASRVNLDGEGQRIMQELSRWSQKRGERYRTGPRVLRR